MLNAERNNLIVKMVDERSSVSVAELVELLNVSGVTIRKTLNELDSKGMLRRTRGGAMSIHVPIIEAEEKEKEKANVKEKKIIAESAYKLIQDGDTVFLDAGSTTLKIATLIKNGHKRHITVVTNALNIANELVKSFDIDLVLIGGSLRHRIMSCVGGAAENTIKKLNFDIAFVGTNSFSLETGVTTPNMLEAQVKQCVLGQAKKKVLVSDASKYGLTTMAHICELDYFNVVITDDSIQGEDIKLLQENGINLVIAKSKKSSD